MYSIKITDIITIKPIFKLNTEYLSIAANVMITIIYMYIIFFIFILYMTSENQTITKMIIRELFWSTVRAYKELEKEILNFDDTFFIFLVFFIIFGWFFLFILIPFDISENILAYVIIMMPYMLFLVIFIPVFILYDQGMFFLTYLRGVSRTSVFVLELIFDYLCVLILFFRVLIQNLRFFFMFLVYFELHERLKLIPEIQYLPWPDKYGGEAITRLPLPRTIAWYILFKLPVLVFSSIYYICHLYTIFVINCFAYVFLVFWLYTIFYTCFYSNKFETFFSSRIKFYTKNVN